MCHFIFVQHDSVQPCLLGTNIIAYLGASIIRANGEALITSPQTEHAVARVCLVQATTIPSQNGHFIKCRVDGIPCRVKCQVGSDPSEVKCCMYEPARDVVELHCFCSNESLIMLNVDGMALPIKLKKGMQLGVVRPYPVKVVGASEKVEPLGDSRCAAVKGLSNTPERFQ